MCSEKNNINKLFSLFKQSILRSTCNGNNVELVNTEKLAKFEGKL